MSDVASSLQHFDRRAAAVIRCVGGFDVRLGEHGINRWSAGKARELFQYLLLREGRLASKLDLETALWPERAVPNRSSSIKVAVHALRVALRDLNRRAAGDSGDSILSVETEGSGYSLQLRGVRVDVHEFARLSREAQYADQAGRPDVARLLYTAAVELGTGEFLPGLYSPWAQLYRDYHRGQLVSVLDRLVDLEVQAGNRATALQWCHLGIETDPSDERVYLQLIELYGESGELHQVRYWFRRCSTYLAEQLAAAPQPATVRAYRRALDRTRASWWGQRTHDAAATGRGRTTGAWHDVEEPQSGKAWRVVKSERRGFALVPPNSPAPKGWSDAGVYGSAQECARWVEGV